MSFPAGILGQSQLLHLKLVLATLKHTFCLMARCKCRAPDFPEGYQGTGGWGAGLNAAEVHYLILAAGSPQSGDGGAPFPPKAPGKDPPCLFRLPVDPGAPRSLPRSHTAIFCPLFPSARGLLLCAWVFASDFPLFIRVRGHPTAVGPRLNRSHLQAPCFQIKPHSRVLGRGLQTSLPGTRLSP